MKKEKARLDAEKVRQEQEREKERVHMEQERDKERIRLEEELAQQEASLRLQQAILEANMEKLAVERDAAATIAEALEAAVYDEPRLGSSIPGLEEDQQDFSQGMSDYVYQHCDPSSIPQQEIKHDISESHQIKQQQDDLRPQCYKQEKSDRVPDFPVPTKPSTPQGTQPSYKHQTPVFTPKVYANLM
ncbi:uncharacterized protein [Aquarana catesbeiana]|uniref:uncharacterized protein isoform X2 n=1 Tax=Aquarana catesbeiana TaxID=8400 RepID=UPI003CCA5A0F